MEYPVSFLVNAPELFYNKFRFDFLNVSSETESLMITAGILSDTHLAGSDEKFQHVVQHCFRDCTVIIHAGDLTDLSLLQAFSDKTVYAVHGNMCNPSSRSALPARLNFQLGQFSFGLTHGAGLGHDIESALRDLFPTEDCVIYGHTHHTVCHRVGGKLIINPGTLTSTGRYGYPGTYAIVTVTDELHASLHEVPNLS